MKKFLKTLALVLLILPCAIILSACGETPPEDKKYFDRPTTYTFSSITVEWESPEVRQQILASNPDYYNEEAFIARHISISEGSYLYFGTEGGGNNGRASGGFTYEINDNNLTLTYIQSQNVLNFTIDGGLIRKIPFSEYGLSSNSYFRVVYTN